MLVELAWASQHTEYLRLLEPNLSNLASTLASWPIRLLACLDFLLDTVPFSFDDPAVTHRRVVLYRAET